MTTYNKSDYLFR